ncbi:hypothetical protein [Phytohabitans suffuscus]|uniref:Uncharacterized protein n=1 Tax=Phytohabitans suffuscus TaxID=624315 RepID=A0A6F8YQ43_9ACTN|nr:hypothetical protein [Phytohabitans suffuscus]BCB88257.1 hypothetical protein Psuf_055700 [Phytohabitans suffuscus]
MCGTVISVQQWQPAPQTGWTTAVAAPRRGGPPLVVWVVLAVALAAVALVVSTVGVGLVRERPAADQAQASSVAPPASVPNAGTVAGPAPLPDQDQGRDEARAQAEEVDELLEWSATSRAKLTAPLAQLDNCRGVAGALDVIRRVAGERERQREAARGLSVGLIEGGPQARTYLVEALDYSYEADLAYLDWGAYLRDSGCSGPGAELRHWDPPSVAAERSAAKERFVARWNGIAAHFGMRRWTAAEI